MTPGEGEKTEPPRRAGDTSAAGGFPHPCGDCGTTSHTTWAPVFEAHLCPSHVQWRTAELLNAAPRLPRSAWQHD